MIKIKYSAISWLHLSVGSIDNDSQSNKLFICKLPFKKVRTCLRGHSCLACKQARVTVVLSDFRVFHLPCQILDCFSNIRTYRSSCLKPKTSFPLVVVFAADQKKLKYFATLSSIRKRAIGNEVTRIHKLSA